METDAPVQQAGDDKVALVSADCLGAVKDIRPGDVREAVLESAEVAGAEIGQDVLAQLVAARADLE